MSSGVAGDAGASQSRRGVSPLVGVAAPGEQRGGGALVLVVEDDVALASVMVTTLRARGYTVGAVKTAAAAMECAAQHHPDVVLLDLGLPDMSGVEVLRSLRMWSQVPVIVVSARHDQQGKIHALDEGADDYVTKPVGVGELLARVRAALRRAGLEQPAESVVETEDGRVQFDVARQVVTCEGERVHLTPHELAMVMFLVRHRGRLVTKKELLRAVWGENYTKENNYLRVYIKQIREKLEVEPSQPQYFVTELGAGYRFVLSAEMARAGGGGISVGR